MTRYADPYVPNPVPQGGSIGELERFLADELQRISTNIAQTSVMAAYGGLTISSPYIGTADITPRQITEWDGFIPAEPNRVTIDATGDAMVVEESGTYHISTQITADTTAGRVYRITLARNGVLSDIYGEWDTSNQTASVNLIFSGIADLTRGDTVSVWVNSNVDGSIFSLFSGVFQIFRISELREVF